MQSQQHSDYFEAIIQLRPESKEVLEFIKKQLSKRDNIQISKINKSKTGLDIYISDQRFARSLGNKLKRSFKGTLTLSRSLHSRSKETNRDLYRVTVCFRLKPQEE